jgi:hypothetical protein
MSSSHPATTIQTNNPDRKTAHYNRFYNLSSTLQIIDKLIHYRNKEQILTKRRTQYLIRKRVGKRKISREARAKLEEVITQEVNNAWP